MQYYKEKRSIEHPNHRSGCDGKILGHEIYLIFWVKNSQRIKNYPLLFCSQVLELLSSVYISLMKTHIHSNSCYINDQDQTAFNQDRLYLYKSRQSLFDITMSTE